MKAPFPYFGGKSRVAPVVWGALGQPAHYLEPFFGSGAVLLNRPDYDPAKHTETINDKDGFVANVWRSLQFSPDETAKWCDWPVNHADLMARKAALIRNENRLLENLVADDKWHDPIMAGYWIWAASCWIGSGLTSPNSVPHIGRGRGVHARGKRPHLTDNGMGVHASDQRSRIYDWFQELSERLRRVRVVCGDWTRVCGGNWQDRFGTVGIFFDPPYSADAERDNDIYHAEDLTVAHAVREWCIPRGEKQTYRIVLAGYLEEHEVLQSHGWRVHRWSTAGGYSNLGDGPSKENRHREALFFSPHCVELQQRLAN